MSLVKLYDEIDLMEFREFTKSMKASITLQNISMFIFIMHHFLVNSVETISLLKNSRS